MKKYYNYVFILFLPVVLVLFFNGISNIGGSPGGHSGSPGDGGNNCTACHLGTPVTQEFWISGYQLMVEGYETGETYDIIIIANDGNASRFGFEATAETSDGLKTGTFSAGLLGMTQTINNNKAVTHTLTGTTPLADTTTFWTFTWTAPASESGDITFYAAINAANGDGDNTGDQIYLSQFTASPASTSINSISSNRRTMFYPNPSTGILYSNLNTNGNYEVSILDVNGSPVRKAMLNEAQGKLDLSDLAKGIYFLQTQNFTQKILLH